MMDSKDSSGSSSQPMLKAEQETIYQWYVPLNFFKFTLKFEWFENVLEIIWKESLNSSIDKSLNKAGLSIIMAVFFIVGEMAGTGIVNLPQAISQTGWIGCGFLILCACMASFTGTKLGKSNLHLFSGSTWRLEQKFRRVLELYYSKRTKI